MLLLTAALACSTAAPPIGSVVRNVPFTDTRYLARSSEDFPKGTVLAFAFLDTGCPLVRRFLPELKRIDREYRGRGVQVVGVFAGEADSITQMAAFAVEHDLPFPVVRDTDGSAVTALGASTTPQVVVLDGGRKLAYRGRIDDQYRPGGTRPTPGRRDLVEALEAVLAGKTPDLAETAVDGCPITPTQPPRPRNDLTFADHIAPIMRRHCQDCHRPNTPAPFVFDSYLSVKSRAKAIARVVGLGQMPPWYGADGHQHFENRRGLTVAEREMLLGWLASSMEAGDLSRLPAPPPPAEDWRIGPPDRVLSTATHELPEQGDIPYRYAILPTVFAHDTWLESAEIKPDNPKVVHHANLAYIKIGDKPKVDHFITGHVPGGEAMTLPPGAAIRIPAGSMLVLQIHFVSTGQPEKCRIDVGLRHFRGEVKQQLRFLYLVDYRFAIPPFAPAHPVTAARTLPCDAQAIGLFMHMHLRGKDAVFRATPPDGPAETLLMIPNYSFDWQHAYRWADGRKRLPKGTRIECAVRYDNSPFNPFNPDPTQTIRVGDQSHEEMLNGFFFYVDADEDLRLPIDAKTGGVIRESSGNG